MRGLVLILWMPALLDAQAGTYPYVIRTEAGSNPLGDAGPATQALLQDPGGIVTDNAGNIHILDTGNLRIRRVDARTGVIQTTAVLGNGNAADLRLSLDERTYYALLGNQVVQITPVTPGVQNSPPRVVANGVNGNNGGLAIDKNGDLYVAEPGAHRVRKIKVSDGSLQIIAGTGTAGFAGDGGSASAAQLANPRGVAIDSSGAIYIADTGNFRVRKIASDGTITTVAGLGTQGRPVDGPGLASPLGTINAISVDGSGSVYLVDTNGNVVLRLATDGTLRRIAGNFQAFGSWDDGPALNRSLFTPSACAIDGAGNLFVADLTHRVRRIDQAGQATTAAGRLHFAGDGGPANAAILNQPRDVVFDKTGNLYVADSLNYRIRRIAPNGVITTYAGNGDGSAAPVDGSPLQPSQPIPYPNAMAYDRSADALYFVSATRLIKIANGTYSIVAGSNAPADVGDGGPASKAQFQRASGVAVDAGGNVYVADAAAQRIRKIATDGTISAFAGTGTRGFSGDGGPAAAAQFAFDAQNGYAPIVADTAGNLYVGDVQNNRVRVIKKDGSITTLASSINAPIGIDVDASGNVFVESAGIVLIAPDGTVKRVAGGGQGPAIDGDIATDDVLNGAGLRVDANGDIHTAGFNNGFLRRLVLNTPSALNAADGDGQSAPVSSPLPKQLRARVVGRGGAGVPGVTVGFAASAGITVSATSVKTENNGVAAVDVTLGATPGTATITASSAGFPSVQFKETATACSVGTPSIASAKSLSDFGGSASFASGSWLEIKGTNLSASTRLWAGADFAGLNAPTILEGTKVTINGRAAFVEYVSPTQINVQAPQDTATGPVQLGVTNCSILGASTTLNKTATAPGFLAPASFNIGGKQYLVALFQDGTTYVGSPSLIPGVPFRPAKPGETIIAYGIGFGAVSGNSAPGVVVTQNNALANFAVNFGGTAARVTFAGLAGGNIGLYQFNIVVPQVADGDYQVQATLGGTAVPQSVFLTVKN